MTTHTTRVSSVCCFVVVLTLALSFSHLTEGVRASRLDPASHAPPQQQSLDRSGVSRAAQDYIEQLLETHHALSREVLQSLSEAVGAEDAEQLEESEGSTPPSSSASAEKAKEEKKKEKKHHQHSDKHTAKTKKKKRASKATHHYHDPTRTSTSASSSSSSNPASEAFSDSEIDDALEAEQKPQQKQQPNSTSPHPHATQKNKPDHQSKNSKSHPTTHHHTTASHHQSKPAASSSSSKNADSELDQMLDSMPDSDLDSLMDDGNKQTTTKKKKKAANKQPPRGGVPVHELFASAAFYAASVYNDQPRVLPGWKLEDTFQFTVAGVRDGFAGTFRSDRDDFLVAVRGGTHDIDPKQWGSADLDTQLIPVPLDPHSKSRVQMHAFYVMRALTLVQTTNKFKHMFIQTLITRCVQGSRVTLVGHSEGGAVASIIAWLIRVQVPQCNLHLITFGERPWVDEAGAKRLNAVPIAGRRFVTECVVDGKLELDALSRPSHGLVTPGKPEVLKGKDTQSDQGLSVPQLCHFVDNYFDAVNVAYHDKAQLFLFACEGKHAGLPIVGANLVDRFATQRSYHRPSYKKYVDRFSAWAKKHPDIVTDCGFSPSYPKPFRILAHEEQRKHQHKGNHSKTETPAPSGEWQGISASFEDSLKPLRAGPSGGPAPTPAPTPRPTPRPTAAPTPAPTEAPTPAPTPAPTSASAPAEESSEASESAAGPVVTSKATVSQAKTTSAAAITLSIQWSTLLVSMMAVLASSWLISH